MLRLLAAVVILACLAQRGAVEAQWQDADAAPAADIITFSGYDWDVRERRGGPGPNRWSQANVRVDRDGQLHLRINRRGGRWYCAEVATQDTLGFGTYEFQVIGDLDAFDPYVVLGLFNYTLPEIGPDGTNEIDIEFGQWGDAYSRRGHYTVYPAEPDTRYKTRTFDASLPGRRSLHRFTWTADQVHFESYTGHVATPAKRIASWTYRPADPDRFIPQDPLPVYINLWLARGTPPTDGRPVEVVIKRFSFTPPE